MSWEHSKSRGCSAAEWFGAWAWLLSNPYSTLINSLASVHLSFLTCKMGIMSLPHSVGKGCVGDCVNHLV